MSKPPEALKVVIIKLWENNWLAWLSIDSVCCAVHWFHITRGGMSNAGTCIKHSCEFIIFAVYLRHTKANKSP